MVPFPLACLMRGEKDFRRESQPSFSKKWEASSLPQTPTSTAHSSGFVPSINHVLSRNLKGGSSWRKKRRCYLPLSGGCLFPSTSRLRDFPLVSESLFSKLNSILIKEKMQMDCRVRKRPAPRCPSHKTGHELKFKPRNEGLFHLFCML